MNFLYPIGFWQWVIFFTVMFTPLLSLIAVMSYQFHRRLRKKYLVV